jgi:hypothetical protein
MTTLLSYILYQYFVFLLAMVDTQNSQNIWLNAPNFTSGIYNDPKLHVKLFMKCK